MRRSLSVRSCGFAASPVGGRQKDGAARKKDFRTGGASPVPTKGRKEKIFPIGKISKVNLH
ncbi:MAG: hypothetical protein Q4E20_04675, partial [Eubacteriales bacterium]|nr:hypothetical protein [Eubacteriales bacterium]